MQFEPSTIEVVGGRDLSLSILDTDNPEPVHLVIEDESQVEKEASSTPQA